MKIMRHQGNSFSRHLRLLQVRSSGDRKKPSAQSQVLDVSVGQQNWLQPPLLFRHGPVQHTGRHHWYCIMIWI